ncbi:hypothetical protein T440DRAFT_51321 [Plenodomus tracheiphilus IPT5]|uniref:Secreted protein n=1 Tax=Plenodomus tracheiphilus IPT5 TaxID=1408161 RepID=A0A6A7BCB4_9PLEO|nr:hypothetical protein T440DRAFT_51321 [Plenodomus tracheiphilus IPT5]
MCSGSSVFLSLRTTVALPPALCYGAEHLPKPKDPVLKSNSALGSQHRCRNVALWLSEGNSSSNTSSLLLAHFRSCGKRRVRMGIPIRSAMSEVSCLAKIASVVGISIPSKCGLWSVFTSPTQLILTPFTCSTVASSSGGI